MALTIPTTADQAATNLTQIETKLNQTTPANDKAYNDITSKLEAGQFTTLYKFAVERAKMNLALTATGDDLKDLARNYGITPKGAVSTVLTFTLPSTATIPSTVDFVGDANGVRYALDADVVPVASVATITATAQTPGTAGNLAVSDTLTIGTQVPGAESTATVTVVDTLGVEAETDDALRIRVLDKIRTEGGGGNYADYREWSQEEPGVFRGYPYAGDPAFLETGLGTISPVDITVYIQADTTIDSDGIPPQSLLDAARARIRFDPDDNGRARQPLPLGNSTLNIEAIIRTGFFVVITNLDVDADIEAQVKTDITTAVTAYFLALRPFIDGLDAEEDKNNKITVNSIGGIVQDVVRSVGGSFDSLSFNTGAGSLVSYILSVHELAKLTSGGISYA